jgi:hypothetical protein
VGRATSSARAEEPAFFVRVGDDRSDLNEKRTEVGQFRRRLLRAMAVADRIASSAGVS